MISADIVAQVKELQIQTRKLVSGMQTGACKSGQKGFGFEFDQLRSYQYGDDIRLIDWKSSARAQDGLLVRQYFEERNRTFIICLDISASTLFGSGAFLKQEIMQQVAGILALAAQMGKDKVGLVLFGDTIEKVVPPAKGEQHVQQLLTQLFSITSSGKKTDLNVLFEYVARSIPKKSVVFVISDFIADNFEKTLKKATHQKELVAVVCSDPHETKLAPVGLVWMRDSETGELVLVDSCKKQLQTLLASRAQEQKKILMKYGIDTLSLQTQRTFMHELMVFFKRRALR